MPYSPKNKSAKATEENSVLNPLTSSLSPSAKSKGARPSSAKTIKTKGRKRNKKRVHKRGVISKLRERNKKQKKKKRKCNLKGNPLSPWTETTQRGVFGLTYNTSKKRTVNREPYKTKKKKKKKIENLKKKKEYGKQHHSRKRIRKIIPGKPRKERSEDFSGRSCSFLISLTPSRIACKMPTNPTLLGPKRPCLNLKMWRSKRVVKATDNKTQRSKTTKKTKRKRNEVYSLDLQTNIFNKI